MRLHFLSVSPSVGRSGVQSSLCFVLWSRQLFYFFVISGNRQKRKRAVSPTPDLWPQLLVLPLLLDFAPLGGGKSVCSGQGGVVCPGISGRLQDSFPVETGFPLRSSLSRSLTLLLVHSLARSAQDQTPISVSWRREQTFTVDELSSSSSNTSLKLSDFHEIKTLFLIMFLSFLPLRVFKSKQNKRQTWCGIMGDVVFIAPPVPMNIFVKEMCPDIFQVITSTQILIGCTWLDGSRSSAPGFQTGPTQFGKVLSDYKNSFPKCVSKDILSEKQAVQSLNLSPF